MRDGRKPTITLAQRAQLLAMQQRGLSQRAMARAAGISQPSVCRLLAEMANEPIPGLPGQPVSQTMVSDFIDSFSDDQSLDALRAIDHREPDLFTPEGWAEFLHWRKTALTRFAERWAVARPVSYSPPTS